MVAVLRGYCQKLPFPSHRDRTSAMPNDPKVSVQEQPSPDSASLAKTDDAHAEMMRNAKTPEQMGVALLGMVYRVLVEKHWLGTDADRRADVELEKREMNYELIKWFFVRVTAIAFVAVAMASVAFLWKSGDRDMAKFVVVALAGVVTGWGAKSAFSEKPPKP